MASTQSAAYRVAHGVAWLGSAKLVSQLGSWMATIVVARTLTPTDYGLVALATVVLLLPELLAEGGVGQAVIQKKQTSAQELGGLFLFNLLLSSGLCALMVTFAPGIALLMAEPELVPVLQGCALGMVLIALRSVPYAHCMRMQRYRQCAAIEVVGNLSGTVAVLGFALAGFGAWSLVYGYLIKHLVLTTGFWLLARPQMDLPRSWVEVSERMRFGMTLCGAEIMRVAYTTSDVLIIGRVLGTQAAGYFGMAYQLATIPLDKIGAIFNRVALPTLSDKEQSPEMRARVFLQIHEGLLVIGAPILVGMALVAEPLVHLLLSPTWAPVVPVLQGLCVVNLLRLSGMVMVPALTALGLAGEVALMNLLCLILLPPGFLLGAQLGMEGVVAAWLILFPIPYIFLTQTLCDGLGITRRQLLASSKVAVLGILAVALAVRAAEPWLPAPQMAVLALQVVLGVLAYGVVIAIAYRQDLAGVLGRLRTWRAASDRS